MNRRQSTSTLPTSKLSPIGSLPFTTVPSTSAATTTKIANLTRNTMKTYNSPGSGGIRTSSNNTSNVKSPTHHHRSAIPMATYSTTANTDPIGKLPKQFVTAMRTLFDIMDDKRTGFVRLTDIEQRWKDDGAKGLPHGVINSLRKVTPPNGLLSFERFCAGLKICLLRNQSESSSSSSEMTSATTRVSSLANSPLLTKDATVKPLRQSSKPLQEIDLDVPAVKPKKLAPWNKYTNTVAVRPNNMFPAVQRALSLPKLSPDSDDLDRISPSGLPIVLPTLNPPPKPPRTALVLGNGVTNINHLDRLDKAEIRHALQNWQMGVLMNEMDAKDKRAALAIGVNRGTADGGSVDSAQAIPATVVNITGVPNGIAKKNSSNRRREPRRHTLQNGIDYNMLKRLKQFEQEKEVLLQGLNAVDRTREWYVRQIDEVQQKIKQLGKMGTYIEQWTDAYDDRLNLQRARVTEVNRQLSTLTGSWERSDFPMHMNLAVRKTSTGIHPPTVSITNPSTLATTNNYQPMLPAKPAKTTAHFPSNDELVANNRLKQHNRQLSDEVTLKSQRIAALERERQSLIRELMASQRIVTTAKQQIHHNNNNLSNVSDEVIF